MAEMGSKMCPWPMPRVFEHGSSTLWLSREVQYSHRTKEDSLRDETAWYACMKQSSVYHSAHVIQQPQDLLQKAFERFKSKVLSESFVPYKFHPRRAKFEPDVDDNRTCIQSVMFEEIVLTDLEKDSSSISQEAYSIDISTDGSALICVLSPLGGLRALDTLAQLFYAHSALDEVYTPYAPALIKDAPFFSHRGLNLDISRNWIPPQDVKRTIEAMAFNKLNKLHLHASDAQSWPLEIPALPSLAKEGAYRADQIWTAEELQDVQEHGLYHGVEVYLEIDLPGHTASIFHSHPDLITAFNKPWAKYALEPPAGQLKLNHPDVPPFLTTLFNDLLPRVSPFSSHFHTGGDEINREAYKIDPTVRSSSKEVIRPLLQAFTNHVVALVEKHNLTPVVWEEMLLEWDLNLPASTVVQSWRSTASLAKVVEKGHRALFGPCEEWYLDCGFGGFIDPDPSNPDTPIKHPFLDWCSPYRNFRQILAFDPLEGVPEDRHHLVLGGEVHLWGELTDSVTLDGMLWPRASAAAEVLWRVKGEVGEASTRRLAEMRERLVARGFRAGMVQMEWGLRNRGGCIL